MSELPQEEKTPLPQEEKTPFPPYLDTDRYYKLIREEPESLAEYLPPDMYREIINQTPIEDLLPYLNGRIPGLYQSALRKVADYLKANPLKDMSLYNLWKLSKHPVLRPYVVAEAKKEFNRSYELELSRLYPEIIPPSINGLTFDEQDTISIEPDVVQKYFKITPEMIEKAVINNNELKIPGKYSKSLNFKFLSKNKYSKSLNFKFLSKNKYIDREYIRQTIDRFPWSITPEILTDDLAISLYQNANSHHIWTHKPKNNIEFYSMYIQYYAGEKFLKFDLERFKILTIDHRYNSTDDEIIKYFIAEEMAWNHNISPEFFIEFSWTSNITPKSLILNTIDNLINFTTISQTYTAPPYNFDQQMILRYGSAIRRTLTTLLFNPKWMFIFDDQMINQLLTIPAQYQNEITEILKNPELTIDRAIRLFPIVSRIPNAWPGIQELVENRAYRLNDVIKILNGVYDNFIRTNPPNTPIPTWLNDTSKSTFYILRPEEFIRYEYERMTSSKKVRLNLPLKYPSKLSIDLNKPDTHLVDINLKLYVNHIRIDSNERLDILDRIINNF